MQLNSVNKNIVLIASTIFLQIPFLEYVVQNLIDLNEIFKTLVSLYAISLVVGLIISKLLNYIFNLKFNEILLFYSIIIFLIFKWHNINLIIKPVISLAYPYISLILIGITIFALFYLILIKKNNSIKSFFYIFFSIYFFYLISVIGINQYIYLDLDKKDSTNNSKLVNNFENISANIYLIVFDGMISPERFEKIYS